MRRDMHSSADAWKGSGSPAAGAIPLVEAITTSRAVLASAQRRTRSSTRGCGAARDVARQVLAEKKTYWATEVEVQRLAAGGWIALRRARRRSLNSCAVLPTFEDRKRNTSSPRAHRSRAELLAEISSK